MLYRSNNPILCNFILEILQENHIPAYLSQEAVGQHIYPVNIGKLSEMEIIVTQKDYSQAKELLDSLLLELESNEREQPEHEDDEFPLNQGNA
ncbi:MAG: DUF2007 domain-containing protein [Anaerolineales bacterium]|nr:DUF2007 domain-containing protein [Anaerolineales bacterium]